ncbi:SEC-C metal-binding domain-containing protein [Thiorhodococcus mannitoliphagus]|uniref:SEC-C metal-binding domain-containing protein n=1 Tax=Thiorhodococcus mannitoliphagus TaxID=329406 RepID=UPI001F0E6D72|nr:SEC-C metal-binding domain-containing protein [Thiorhodococcus mannitoliphagus]
MTNLIDLAKGKLNDPILMDWAIDRYKDAAPAGASRRHAMESNWFDEVTLQRWLDSNEEELLGRLFRELPTERFASLGGAISARWSGWSNNLAHQAAFVFGRVAPDLALACFRDAISRHAYDVFTLARIAETLPLLPEPGRSELLQHIAAAAADGRLSQRDRTLLLDAIIRFGFAIDAEIALDAARERLTTNAQDDRFQAVLNAIGSGILGTSPYFRLASEIRANQTEQRFLGLSALFRDDAPLEQLDRLCQDDPKLPDLTTEVERFVPEPARAHLLAIVESVTTGEHSQHREALADMLVGAVAASCELSELDASSLSLPSVVELLSVDIEFQRHLDALYRRLEAFPPEEVAPALIKALAKELVTFGAEAIAECMGRLGWEAFIPSLMVAINEDSGNVAAEVARDALIRIGAPAADALLRDWKTLDTTQQIYGLSVIEGIGGEPAVRLGLDHQDELLAEDPESWTRLVSAAPDPRLLERLEPLLPRKQSLLDEAFYVTGTLLDADKAQLADVGQRVLVRRKEHREQLAALMGGNLARETLRLTLSCPDCGSVNSYQVGCIAVAPKDPDIQPILAEEVACVACGNWSDLRLTTEATLAVMGELLILATQSKAGAPIQSKIIKAFNASMNGKTQAIGRVLATCQAAVDADSSRLADWLRLAYCYQIALSRPHFAARFRAKALELDPNAVEAVLLEASARMGDGRLAEAMTLLEQALAAKERWRFLLSEVGQPRDIAGQFAQLYNNLLDRLNRVNAVRLHPAFLGGKKKVGRNDPCPCGSGKKYKKCCLSSD